MDFFYAKIHYGRCLYELDFRLAGKMIRVRVIIKRATYFSIAFGALVFSFIAGYDIGCFVVFDVQFPNFLTTFS